MSISTRELWKSRYLNELNMHCCMYGYSATDQPLIKGQWTKIKWEECHLDDYITKYCCYKIGENDEKEKELCMNCAGWLDKYHLELTTRKAEERGIDTLVPLLEQIIENQDRLRKGINDISEWLEVIARNTDTQK
jgi:hypothetical protein